MASEKQIAAFASVADRATFPAGTDLPSLKKQFEALPVAEASRWIERALLLPKGEDSGAPVPF